MKKINRFKYYATIGFLAFNFIGCGEAVDIMDSDNVIIDDEQKKEGGVELGNVSPEVLEGELKGGIGLALDFDSHKYQYQRANNIDVFSGYFTVAKSKFDYGPALYHTYYYPNGYYNGPIGESKKLYPQLYHAYFFGEEHGNPEWKAIAEIIYAYNMQELVDFFGAIPYNDYRNLKETNPLEYLSTEETYKAIFNDLEEAINILKTTKPSAEKLRKVEGDTGGYSKLDWKNWVKFANSIRLRMALNMVKIQPGEAQIIAENAVNDEIGVLDNEDFGLPHQAEITQHPLYQICSVWNDSRLGASLENIMKRYHNPLLEKWFSPNEDPIKSASNGKQTLPAKNTCLGIRQGTAVFPTSNINGYRSFSKFKDQYMPRTYFKVTEVLFLRAEGALRGWSMNGTAKDLYYQGIKKVFDENAIDGYDKYIEQKTADNSIVFKDYHQPEYSVLDPTRGVQVGVKWEDSDTEEVMLEKIITQKYIAIFPNSAEAWTTFRRTGYPRLFPVPEDNAWPDGSFDVELQLRRIPYDESSSTDQSNIGAIEAALGGDNTAGLRLWWDVPTEGRDENNRIIPKNFGF